MSKIPDREYRMVYCNAQLQQKILYAQYWMAMATTGAATQRNMTQGWEARKMTDMEKTQDALDTALRHIRQVEHLGACLAALTVDDPEGYQRAQDNALRC